ncbi:unnamed protein product, partial [Ectocarpus fasciculatus]
ADRESHRYDNSCLDSSDDEEGGVGSLSQFSFRRNRQAAASSSSSSSAARTSRPKTALQVMQEHKCACSTTKNNDCRTRSTAGRYRDLGGAAAGSTPDGSTGANEAWGNPRAHATGGAYILRPEISAPTSQSATPYMDPASLTRPPSLQRAPYLSLDGAEEPIEDLAFDLSFDFPFDFGNGSIDGNGSAATAATADMKGIPDLSVWNDYGLGRSGGDSSAVCLGGGGGGGGGGGATAGDNALATHEGDTCGILDDEDDEAALAMAADRLLGYASTGPGPGPGPAPGSTPRPSRGPIPSSLPPPPGFSRAAAMDTRQPWLGDLASAAGGSGAGCSIFGKPYMNPSVGGRHRRRSKSRLRFCNPEEGMGDDPVSRDGEDVTPFGLLAAVNRQTTERVPAGGAGIGEVGAAVAAEPAASVAGGGKGASSGDSSARNGGSSLYGRNERNLVPRPAPQPTFRTAENSRLSGYARVAMVDQDSRAGSGGINSGLSHEVASPEGGNDTSAGNDDLADGRVPSGDGGNVCGDEGRGRSGGGSRVRGNEGDIARELQGSGDRGGGGGRDEPIAEGQRRCGVYPSARAYLPIVSYGGGEERPVGLAGGEMGRAGVAPAEGVRSTHKSDDSEDGDDSNDRHRAGAVAAAASHGGRSIGVAPSLPARSAVLSQPGGDVAGAAREAEGSAAEIEDGRRMLHDALLHVGGAVVAEENGQRVVGGGGLAIEGNQGSSA